MKESSPWSTENTIEFKREKKIIQFLDFRKANFTFFVRKKTTSTSKTTHSLLHCKSNEFSQKLHQPSLSLVLKLP